MSDTNQNAQQNVAATVADTVLKTAEQMAPAVLTGAATAGAAVDPKVALALQLAPIALQFLQSAQQLAQANLLPPDQLASLFASIGTGIKASHDEWAAMNIIGQVKFITS